MLCYLSLFIFAALLLQPCFAKDPTSNPHGTVGYENATKDIYGLGVRIGIYCQVAAFMVGFQNLLRLEVKGLFGGVILSWTLLIRWFARAKRHDLSRPESWIAIALVLSFTVPGVWLLRFVFQAQRRKLVHKMGEKAARRQVVEGQGLNIMMVVISTFGVMVANGYFSFYLVYNTDRPNGVKDLIWMLAPKSPDSAWIRFALGIQAILSFACAYPAIRYSTFWVGSIWYWWHPKKDQPVEAPSTWRQKLQKRFENWGLAHKWLYFFLGFVAVSYSSFLILSVEMTIRAAGLTPEMDLLGPGQLIPLVTGSISLLSALADFARRRGPNEIAPWDLGGGRESTQEEDEIPLRRWESTEYGDSRRTSQGNVSLNRTWAHSRV